MIDFVYPVLFLLSCRPAAEAGCRVVAHFRHAADPRSKAEPRLKPSTNQAAGFSMSRKGRRSTFGVLQSPATKTILSRTSHHQPPALDHSVRLRSQTDSYAWIDLSQTCQSGSHSGHSNIAGGGRRCGAVSSAHAVIHCLQRQRLSRSQHGGTRNAPRQTALHPHPSGRVQAHRPSTVRMRCDRVCDRSSR